MYYRLHDDYAFRGWVGLPFALAALRGKLAAERPKFFDKPTFLTLLRCNGAEDVDTAALDEKRRGLLDELVKEGALEASEAPLPRLNPEQRYVFYPAIYMQSIHWSITGKCNYRCRHCLVSAPDGRHSQLPLADCLHIVEELAACGVRAVSLTGGDPLARADFAELARALTEKGVRITTMFTNGALLTPELLDLFDELGQSPAFQISFDGFGQHDWLRGVPGAEKAAIRAIKLLVSRNFPVSCAMCIHKRNRDTLRETANFLASLGVGHLGLNAPQCLGCWNQYAEEFALSPEEEYQTYLAYIPQYFADGMPLELMLDGYFFCRKGRTDYRVPFVRGAKDDADLNKRWICPSFRYNAHISPEGRLMPCMGFEGSAIGEKFPNILDMPLSEATKNSLFHDVVYTKLGAYMAHNGKCAKCDERLRCAGGCRASGLGEGGDYLGLDEHTCFFHLNVGEAQIRAAADAAIKKYCIGA